jgi:hypothetical protein
MILLNYHFVEMVTVRISHYIKIKVLSFFSKICTFLPKATNSYQKLFIILPTFLIFTKMCSFLLKFAHFCQNTLPKSAHFYQNIFNFTKICSFYSNLSSFSTYTYFNLNSKSFNLTYF